MWKNMSVLKGCEVDEEVDGTGGGVQVMDDGGMKGTGR